MILGRKNCSLCEFLARVPAVVSLMTGRAVLSDLEVLASVVSDGGEILAVLIGLKGVAFNIDCIFIRRVVKQVISALFPLAINRAR